MDSDWKVYTKICPLSFIVHNVYYYEPNLT